MALGRCCAVVSIAAALIAGWVAPGLADTVLRRPTAAEPETLDPHKTTSNDDIAIDMDLFEPLVGRDADQNLIPGAAASWTVSEDGLVYTFHLRPDGRWSNGEPVTAEDFVFALRRLVAPATGAADISPIRRIVAAPAINAGRETDATKLGVEAIDPLTLRIRLTERQSTLPLYLSSTYGMPLNRAEIERAGEAWTRPGNLVGNGPYRLDSWVPSSEIVLVRNAYFHDPAGIAVDQVHYLVTDVLETGLKRYLTGELDWAIVPPPKLPWAHESRAAELHSGAVLGIRYLFFNLKSGKLAPHPKLREALSLAVDREALADKVAARGEQPAYGWVTPVIPAYRTQAYAWQAMPMAERIARARSLLAEEGYGPDHPLAVTISYGTEEVTRKTLLAIASMWKSALGVEVTLSNQEWRVYVAAVEQWDFEIGNLARSTELADPSILLEPFLSDAGANSDTAYANPGFDALLAQAEASGDPPARLRLLERAEAMMLADYPAIPLSYTSVNRLVTPRIRDWRDGDAFPQTRNIKLAPPS
jgi:oligopeptide transport system substrate-binding protein